MENGKRSHKDKVFVVIIVLKLKAEIPFDQKFTFISSCLKLFSEKKNHKGDKYIDKVDTLPELMCVDDWLPF